jgi:hypothetical protein
MSSRLGLALTPVVLAMVLFYAFFQCELLFAKTPIRF